jgi:multidrug resistance protein
MTSRDDNDYGDRRSMQGDETGRPVISDSSTHNNEDNHVPLSAISNQSTSIVNGSSHPSSTLPVSFPIVVEEMSIYNVRTNLKRHLILAAASFVGFLLTFSDTVYLPALNAIQNDLNTSQTLVVVSVSIYLFMNGIFSLVWGPISDRFGRKITIIVTLTVFVTVSIVCIFAPNIAVFIVFRALQGAAVSATLVVGQGIVADIYPAKSRGSATGIFFMPVLIGPVIGPLIGGGLSGAFGWRSTFICLTILSFVILVMMFFLVPETHQYFVKERFHKANPNKRITDAEPNNKPSLEAPWKPLTFLADLTIVFYIIVATTTFTGLFISVALFSIHLHDTPYNYSEAIIGVLFIPTGVASLIGSLFGGWLSDKSSLHYKDEICPEGRLVPGIAFSILTPIGLIIYGWSFHYKVHLTGPIIGLVVLTFGQSILQPGVFSYLTAKKQKEAAMVSAANTALNFGGAGIGVTVAVPLQTAMGTGPFFSLICGINVVAIAVASILVYKQIRKMKRVAVQQKDTVLETTKPDDSIVACANGHTITNDEHLDN